MHASQQTISTYIMHSMPKSMLEKLQRLFHVGDMVRIVRKKGTFEKGFTPNWKEEVFTITTVKATKPPTYTIEDSGGSRLGIWGFIPSQ